MDQAIVEAQLIFAAFKGLKMPALAGDDRPLKPSGSSSYILLVQHLIEKCIVFNLDRGECAEALLKYANILPAITITVWNELEKENKEFFSSYSRNMKNRKKEDYCGRAAPEQMFGEAAVQVHLQRFDHDFSNCR